MTSDFLADVQSADDTKVVLGKLADAFKEAGLEPSDVGAIEKIKFYEGFYKDDEGTAHTVPQVSFHIDPTWRTGPEWPVVQRAEPAQVRPVTCKRKVLKGWHKAVVLPDIQFGYRRYEDGSLDPFHDEAAIDVALQIVRDIRPDRVILLGDTRDFPEWGKYEQLPEFVFTTQPTIDRNHRFYEELRACAPEAQIDELEGNHDRRLPKSIAKNAMSALRLRQANIPEGWPVMSVQHLLRMDELGIRYFDGYPASECQINDNLIAVHGHKVNSAGSTAARVISDERMSVIFGHVHRIEMQHKTRRGSRGSRKQHFAATPGCLCRTDGAVPGLKGSTDITGRPVPTHENWQQGLAVVTFEEGDGRFDYEQIEIIDGNAIYRDKEYCGGRGRG